MGEGREGGRKGGWVGGGLNMGRRGGKLVVHMATNQVLVFEQHHVVVKPPRDKRVTCLRSVATIVFG